MADWFEDIRRVQVRRKHTFDAGAAPGLSDTGRPDLKSVSGDLVDELEEISEQQSRRQDRIAKLEARLEEKDEEIAALEDQLEAEKQNNETVERLADKLADAAAGGEGGGEALEEIREEKNAEIRELENQLEAREAHIGELEAEVSELQQELQQRPDVSERAVEAVDVLAEEFGAGAGDESKWKQKYQKAQERIEELENEQPEPESPDVLEHPAVQRQVSRLQNEIAALDEKETAMLEWYKFYGPGNPKDAYFHAGGSRTSSLVSKKNKTLKEKGFVEKVERGEYEYAVDEKVREQFADNPQIGDAEMEALISEVESEIEVAASA